MCGDVNSFVYLDADVLVQQALTDVPRPRREDLALASVDPPVRQLWQADYLAPLCEANLVADPTTTVRNSGVLVVNAAGWRNESVGERLTEFAKRHAELLVYADQDAINALIGPRIGDLPRTFNHQVHYDGLSADAAVLHYSGGFKPWSPQVRRTAATRHWLVAAKAAFAAAGMSYARWSLNHRLQSLRKSVGRRLSAARHPNQHA